MHSRELMNQGHYCEIPFSFSTMNPPRIFTSSFGFDVSVGETPQRSLSFPGVMAPLSQPFDELSALVPKCNVMGSRNPFVSLDTFVVPISGGVPCGSFNKEDKAHLRCNNEQGGRELQESLARKQSGCQRSHTISERQRRSDMNRLFEQMYSLLPNPTAKKEKASIISETISYIESLQQQLAIYSGRVADNQQPKHINISTLPQKRESLSSVPEIRQPSSSSSDCVRSSSVQYLCSISKEENLLVNYKGRDIFITINCAKKAKLLPSIIFVVESYGMQVVDAFVSTTNATAFHFLRVQAAHILNPAAGEALHVSLKKLIESECRTRF